MNFRSQRRPARPGASLGALATQNEEEEEETEVLVTVSLSLLGRKCKSAGEESALRKKRSLGRFREWRCSSG